MQAAALILRLGAALALALTVATMPAAAQDVSLSCLDGGRLSAADLGKGTTIVVVWASWSPRSRDIAERVAPLAARWNGRARVVTVSFQEERAAVERFLAGKKLGAPVCLDPDGDFSHKYNVSTLPALVVVKDGASLYEGRLPDDADAVIAPLLR